MRSQLKRPFAMVQTESERGLRIVIDRPEDLLVHRRRVHVCVCLDRSLGLAVVVCLQVAGRTGLSGHAGAVARLGAGDALAGRGVP